MVQNLLSPKNLPRLLGSDLMEQIYWCIIQKSEWNGQLWLTNLHKTIASIACKLDHVEWCFMCAVWSNFNENWNVTETCISCEIAQSLHFCFHSSSSLHLKLMHEGYQILWWSRTLGNLCRGSPWSLLWCDLPAWPQASSRLTLRTWSGSSTRQ